MSSFGPFAEAYDQAMGDTGDHTHQHTINPALFELIGDAKDLVIYDIACGNGYIARRLVREGAKEVWASDIADELVTIAQTKYLAKDIKYFTCNATDFSSIPEEKFDTVIMNMAIFYIDDISQFVSLVAKSLKIGGSFIFSCDHPLKFSAYRAMNTLAEDLIQKRESQYLEERKETTFNHWNKEQGGLTLYYRPLSCYINHCSKHGLLVSGIREPTTNMSYKGAITTNPIPTKIAIKVTKVAQ